MMMGEVAKHHTHAGFQVVAGRLNIIFFDMLLTANVPISTRIIMFIFYFAKKKKLKIDIGMTILTYQSGR